jgi:thiamine biosynthesis protein ThiS
MQLTVNDQPRTLPEDSTVADLLRELTLTGTACAVEVNRRLVPKKEHASRALEEGDRVEIVTLVGGG